MNSADGEVAYQATGGKRMLQHMSDDMKLRLLLMGAHAAHDGNVKVSQCWRFDKIEDNHKLKQDGSNFFEVATRVF